MEKPFVPVAFTVLTGVLGYGFYSYKRRPAHVSALSFGTRLRVIAQGSFILCCLGGVVGMDLMKWG